MQKTSRFPIRFGNGRIVHVLVEMESLAALDAWQTQFNVDKTFKAMANEMIKKNLFSEVTDHVYDVIDTASYWPEEEG